MRDWQKQHITLKEVKAACRKAYAERRLIAQHSDQYAYRDLAGHVCAIGAALSDKTLDLIEEEGLQVTGLGDSNGNSLLPFRCDPKELSALVELQGAHDRCVASFSLGATYNANLAKFRKLIEA